MVVSLWRRGNRCGAAMGVQTLRRGTARILRYRLTACDLLLHAALRAALGKRRHGRTGGTGCDRRLAFLLTTAEADIGEALQQRQLALLRMVLLGLTPSLANLGLGRHRQLLEFGHARRTDRGLLRRLRN